jgi:general secretion pathway protein D
MKDGETIILGGLLKDVKSKESIGIPVLSKIPFLGPLFRRDIDDVKKIDLLICISARVVRENELSAEEIAKLEAQLGQETVVKKEVAAADKKKKKNKK